MADCLYHGYSGGPGECKECLEEERRKLDPGTLEGPDQSCNQELSDIASQGPEAYRKMLKKGKK